ncbi:MAG: tellurite resistance TerB family protein [Paramuribaculum sp.]|nr:tellurite resistance TerB family protein [Paramuribaculum sp.]
MGLLDSLNDLAKKSESIVSNGSDISKSLSQIVQDGAKIVSSALPAKNNSPKASVKNKPEQQNVSKETEPMSFKSIGCSDKTISIIRLSLSDGIIDDKEKALILRRVQEEDIDVQEFDFLLCKALENYQRIARNCIKDLSAAFVMAEKIAAKEEKANGLNLASALPKVAGMVSDPTAMASAAVSDTIMNTIGTFIKAPSKLNTFKAEIIRMIDIPLFPEVLIDFFSYASSQINEETQRNKGKGLFTEWSETLFGKDIDLVPIWKDKMAHVMGKAVLRYGNEPQIMMLFTKWRISPLKKLMNLTDPTHIEEFPFPTNVSDYIEVLDYAFRISQDPSKPLKEAYSKLHQRIYREGTKKYSWHPKAFEAMEECRIRPVMEIMANINNPAALAIFETPERLSDLLEVLAYLRSNSNLKKLHQRIYNEGCMIFNDDPVALNKINGFKPKNIFGL